MRESPVPSAILPLSKLHNLAVQTDILELAPCGIVVGASDWEQGDPDSNPHWVTLVYSFSLRLTYFTGFL